MPERSRPHDLALNELTDDTEVLNTHQVALDTLRDFTDRANRTAGALLRIHHGLYPENYSTDLEPGEELWTTETIEWVADDIARALKAIGHPAARFTQRVSLTKADA